MKLVFLSTRYMTGGASLNAVMLAQQMADRGHDCEVWFLMKAGELETFDLKTRIFADTTKLNVSGWLKMLKDFYSASREQAIDGMFSFYPLTNILGSITKLFGKTKTFIGSQQNPVQEQNPVLYWLEMVCGSTPLYDANVTVSQDVADSCHKHPTLYRKKVCVIHNGVPPLPEVSESDTACRDYFGLPADGFLLGSVGRLDPQKNVRLLIEIMPALPYAYLAIAGTGSLEKELRKLAVDLNVSERVFFLGNQPIEQAAKLFKISNIFTFATFYEGFGRTLVESFSVGTPVIASDLPVLREVGGDAAVYAHNTTEAWVNAINDLYHSPVKREALIKKGYARTQHFTLDRMVDQHLNLIP